MARIELGDMDRMKSVHAKQEDVVLVVPTIAQRYRNWLYGFNFVLAGLGLTLISLAVLMYLNPDKVLMPSWSLWYFLVMGLFQLIFGLVAARGAVLAKKRIERGQCNWYLIVFQCFMSLLLLFELLIVAMIVISSLSVKQDEVSGGSNFVSTYLETSMEKEFENRDEFWWEVQKSWECCGWDNNTIPDTLATGKFCTTDSDLSAQTCKGEMTDYVQTNQYYLIGFGSIFMLAQMMVWYSACQLGCCIQAMEPVYSSSAR